LAYVSAAENGCSSCGHAQGQFTHAGRAHTLPLTLRPFMGCVDAARSFAAGHGLRATARLSRVGRDYCASQVCPKVGSLALRPGALLTAFERWCAALARDTYKGCTGCAPPRDPAADVSVHVYELPLELSFGEHGGDGSPRVERFRYRRGAEQYATELVVPRLFRESRHRALDPARADFYLVPFPGVARFYHHRNKTTGALSPRQDAEYLAALRWVVSAHPWWNRTNGTDHMWLFPSGRGASIFPSWRQHVAQCIFLSPEGDARSGRFDGRKDIVIPGYRIA
jgi:hypothetical protein